MYPTKLLAALALATSAAHALCFDARIGCSLNIQSTDPAISGQQIYFKPESAYFAGLRERRLTTTPLLIATAPPKYPTSFYTRSYKVTSTLAFYPTRSDGLMGLQRREPGLLTLVEIIYPEPVEEVAKQQIEYGGFTLDEATGVLGVEDGTKLLTRKWVAYQENGGYNVALYDGVTKTSRTLIDISIVAKDNPVY